MIKCTIYPANGKNSHMDLTKINMMVGRADRI
ncbi:hypothetical protein DI53_1518 [Sphingobacterium deserti]|uniref:Uncharacterized protein n=1 Tax=Sphingobacterium deserti TaxID=1229276 RepID=A0A0B8T7K7_9SPHI|nr:hypothetical protein DI53_1518 [Sphingobacterium deserti]